MSRQAQIDIKRSFNELYQYIQVLEDNARRRDDTVALTFLKHLGHEIDRLDGLFIKEHSSV